MWRYICPLATFIFATQGLTESHYKELIYRHKSRVFTKNYEDVIPKLHYNYEILSILRKGSPSLEKGAEVPTCCSTHNSVLTAIVDGCMMIFSDSSTNKLKRLAFEFICF